MYKFSLQLLVLSVLLFPSIMFSQLNFEKDFFNHYPKDLVGADQRSLQSANTGNYDVVHCKLELTVDPAVYYIDGIATTSFIPLTDDFNAIYFDFTNQIPVSQVLFEGNPMAFSQLPGDELRVDFPEVIQMGNLYEIQIEYAGVPASSGFGSFAIANQCGNQQIPSMWTLSEPYGAKHWWPCKQTLNDKYASVEIIIHTPERYRAASNGTLIEETQNGNMKTYHWSHQYAIPAYLVAFAVSEYEVYSDWVPLSNSESLEILNYIFPCNLNYAKSKTPVSVPIMQFYREKFGEYPYVEEKYGHCNFGWGGGMEHSTMSFMGGFSHLLIAHEMAHQWFGDKITCGSWQDIWLNEGFATYLEGLTYDFGVSPGEWENWKYNNQNRATNDPTGSVYVDDTTSVNRIFNGNLSYAKGAYLLHMLRWKMGDQTFFTALNNYINDPELIYGYAKTPDLQKHLEEVSGMDLNEFFKDWLYGGGYPVYEIIWEQTNTGTMVVVNQTPTHPQSVDFFEMPIPIHFYGNGQDTTVVLDPQFSGQMFTVDIPFPVTVVEFDPERWICAKSSVLTNVNGLSEDKWNVFPNPATDFLRIENLTGDLVKLTVTDVLGKTVMREQFKGQKGHFFELNIESLKPGIYTVGLDDNTKKISTQIVVQ